MGGQETERSTMIYLEIDFELADCWEDLHGGAWDLS